MKKLFSLILALCLLCSGAALADNNTTTITDTSTSKNANTTVSYKIDENESFTVTIPASVTLTAGEGETSGLSGNMTILLDANSFNVSGKGIDVKLSNAAFKLANGSNKIDYTIQKGEDAVKKGDTVLSWAFGSGTFKASQELTITAQSVADHLPAGEYKDTLTFAVSVTASTTGE